MHKYWNSVLPASFTRDSTVLIRLRSLLSVVTTYSTSSFFFFQAEDGIRDGRVTGVQTCALPICTAYDRRLPRTRFEPVGLRAPGHRWPGQVSLGTRPTMRVLARRPLAHSPHTRSEERRVGKECGSRGLGWRSIKSNSVLTMLDLC